MKPLNSLAIIMLSLLVSCSVKEDRESCDCVLNLDISNLLGYCENVEISGWAGECVFKQEIVSDSTSGLISLLLPRGRIEILSMCFSSQCPDSLYASTLETDLSEESNFLVLSLSKQFCVMEFDVSALGMEPDSICLSGLSDGFELPTLEPRTGSYRAVSSGDSDGLFRFVVPRQRESSLTAVMFMPESEDLNFDIGEALESKGFDWKAVNLSDIRLMVSECNSGVEIVVAPWEI